MAALSTGTNGGRLISASRPPDTASTPPAPAGQEVATFSHAGAADSTLSGPYAARARTQLTGLTIAAGSAASTSSTLALYVNGTSTATVTLPAGNVLAGAILTDLTILPGDLLTVALTTAGTGLSGVTVHVDGIAA